MSAILLMSDIFSVGFPGVSICTSLVLGRMAASTFSGSEESTMVVSTPYFLLKSSFRSLYTAIYVTSENTTWSPLFRVAKNRPESAATPEASTTQSSPPSREAILSWRNL